MRRPLVVQRLPYPLNLLGYGIQRSHQRPAIANEAETPPFPQTVVLADVAQQSGR